MEWGLAIGLFAAAIAAILPGMGSAKAVGLAGETAAGVSAETPEASSKLTLSAAAARNAGYLRLRYRYRDYGEDWHHGWQRCRCAGR